MIQHGIIVERRAMTKISRLTIDPKDMGLFISNFWVTITLLEDKEEVKNFLKDLLSHTEMKMLAKRLQIAKMLLSGYNYVLIKNYVKVTDQTIAKINNLIHSDSGGFEKAINLLTEYEKVKQKKLEQNSSYSLTKKYHTLAIPDEVAAGIKEEIKKHHKRQSIYK